MFGSKLESAVVVTRYLMSRGARVRFHSLCVIGGRSPKSCTGTSISYDWFVGLCKSCAKPNTIYKPTNQRLLKLTISMMRGEDVKGLQRIVGVQVDRIHGKVTRMELSEETWSCERRDCRT